MSTMIERMARAIHAADAENWWYDFDLSMYEPQARAALTALLEPTEAMTASVIAEPIHLYDDDLRGADYQRDMKNAVMIERAVLTSRFREMIQAALDEKEGV